MVRKSFAALRNRKQLQSLFCTQKQIGGVLPRDDRAWRSVTNPLGSFPCGFRRCGFHRFNSESGR